MQHAGWYQDPWNPKCRRYFDGQRWTLHQEPVKVPRVSRLQKIALAASTCVWLASIPIVVWYHDKAMASEQPNPVDQLAVGFVLLAPILILTFAGILATIAWDARRQRRRLSRDTLAVQAAYSNAQPGVSLYSLAADHPIVRSISARTPSVASVLAPSNPFWCDSPALDETWWHIATSQEEWLSGLKNSARSESNARFSQWLSHVRASDPATYRAYVSWSQQQQILEAQRQTLAEQRRIAAQQSTLIAQNQELQRGQQIQTQAINAARAEAAHRHEMDRWYPNRRS